MYIYMRRVVGEEYSLHIDFISVLYNIDSNLLSFTHVKYSRLFENSGDARSELG